MNQKTNCPQFPAYACEGDRIEWTAEGFDIVARLEYDTEDVQRWRNDDWFYVGVVLSDDPAQCFKLRGFIVIRSNLPNQLTGFFADDEYDIRFTAVGNNVVRVEAFITGIVPFVGT